MKLKSYMILLAIVLVLPSLYFVPPVAKIAKAATTLFSDDFETGSDGWGTNSGTWAVVADGGSNQYKQSDNTGVGFAYPTNAGYSSWTNYSVQADVTIKTVNTAKAGYQASISARYLDNNNRYAFVLNADSGNLEIRKKISGTETTIVSKAYTINVGTKYTLKGVVNGSTLELWVNGVKELTTTDTSRTSGKISLNTYGTASEYDNVVVTDIGNDGVTIVNEQKRLDTNGNEIQAESGGITKYNGKYWWFGRNGQDTTQINSYSSTDLVNWVFEGTALDIPSGNACRPWVFRNDQNNNFVMIIGLSDGTRPQLTFYTSNSITGPYTFANQIAQPDGWPMGDVGGFQDGTNAYALFNSDANGVANSRYVIAQLNASYTDIASIVYRSDYAVNKHEAYSIIKNDADGYYYTFSSMTSGWEPSKTMWKRATTLSGFPTTGGLNGDGWQELNGSVTNKTGTSQQDFILKFTGTSGTAYLLAGDRWPNHSATYDPAKGKSVWYPLTFSGGVPTLEVDDNWTLNIADGTWSH